MKTAVNLISTLAEKKQKILLVDLDPQGSASIWLGFKNPSKGLFTFFTENVSILDIVDKTLVSGLDFDFNIFKICFICFMRCYSINWK